MDAIIIKSMSYIMIIFIGYLLKQKGIVNEAGTKLLSNIIMKVTMPFMIIVNAKPYNVSMEFLWIFIFSVVIGYIAASIGWFFFRKESETKQAVAALNCAGYNVGNLALPFVLAFYSTQEASYAFMFDLGNTIVCFGGAYVVIASIFKTNGDKGGFKFVVDKLLSSPPFITYILVFVLSLIKVDLPAFIIELGKPISNANIFMVMLMIGTLLNFEGNKKMYFETVKLLVIRYSTSAILALVVVILNFVPDVGKEIIIICLFSSATSIAPIYSLELGDKSATPALLNSVSIISSIVIISIMLIVFGRMV